MSTSQKIKVLHVSSERTWRGGEQQIAYLIEELQRLGVDNLVAVKSGSAFEQYCQSKNIPFFSLPFSGSVDLKSASTIKAICRDRAIHLVHMHSSKSHSIAVLSSWLGNKTPMILSRRVDFVPKNSWFTRWKYNHPGIKKILCVSDKINRIIRAYIREPEKSMTVHSGIDLKKFATHKQENVLRQEFHINSDTFIIGNTSALADHKDYFTFIHTVKILVEKNFPVIAFIIGEGPLEKELKEYVTLLSLNGKVIFTGFRNDIVDVLPSLDLFLITSKEEGLGTSVLDAFAARVPVVATAAGGIPEMVVHHKTGLLAEVEDSQTLSHYVEQVLTNDQTRQQLVEGASEKLKEFSKEQTALKTLQVYEDVIRG